MKSGKRDRAEGKAHQARGSIKESVGNLVGNPDLKAEGKLEHAEGELQEKVGALKNVLGK